MSCAIIMGICMNLWISGSPHGGCSTVDPQVFTMQGGGGTPKSPGDKSLLVNRWGFEVVCRYQTGKAAEVPSARLQMVGVQC